MLPQHNECLIADCRVTDSARSRVQKKSKRCQFKEFASFPAILTRQFFIYFKYPFIIQISDIDLENPLVDVMAIIVSPLVTQSEFHNAW